MAHVVRAFGLRDFSALQSLSRLEGICSQNVEF